ncbi:glycosyltransferase family 92 protein [Rhodobacterales bacterium HKCCSP123]|nr:glycosyltransferase family 92 protein [Rhodobacterales bacterium HKCCSP123]
MAGARVTLLSMVKDEGPRLLEWLAYHRLIGADEVFVFTNDCRDGSDAMLDRLEAMGLARHLRNAVPEGKKPQPHALTLAERHAEIRAAEWLMVLDADEFVHVKTGDGSFAALLDACPDRTEGVAITWRMMGSSGVVEWSDRPLLPQFTLGAPEDFRRGWGVKTLFRPFPHLKLGIHRPTVKGAARDPARARSQLAMRWVNGSGVPMPPSFLRNGWRGSAATVGRALAEVAHFAVQGHEAYLLRGDRGNVNRKPAKYDATYFAVFDRNEVDLPGLSRWSDRVASLAADWLRDAELSRLRQASVDWHRARLDALRAGPG